MKHLKVPIDGAAPSMNYCHYDSIHDFLDCLVSTVEDNILDAANNSPGKLYALMMDESTDTSRLSTLMMYIRFVDGTTGLVRNHFLCVTALEGNCALDIFNTSVLALESKGLDPSNIISLGNDGASVMTGVKAGVGALFKNKFNPAIIQNHCMSHRLALASQKAAGPIPYLSKFIESVNGLHKMFHDSPKMKRLLERCNVAVSETDEGDSETPTERPKSIKPVFFPRWLSFHLAVVALVSCMAGLLTCLTTAANDNRYSQKAKCAGFLKKLATYQFIATCYFLKDCMELLSFLCKALQRDNLQYHDADVKLKATVASLQSLQDNDGISLSQFKKLVCNDPPENGKTVIFDQEITDNGQERDRFQSVRVNFINNLVSQLNAWFPAKENKIVKSLSVLDPRNIPDDVPPDYGLAEIAVLGDHFGKSGQRTEESGSESDSEATEPPETRRSEPLVQAEIESLEAEWFIVLNMMKRCRTMTLQEFYARHIHPDLSDCFPNTGMLYVVALTNVLTSVPCERGFSCYNLTKTPSRNRLKIETVNKSMMIRLEGPCLAKFDFEQAYNCWFHSEKDRRGFTRMLQLAEARDR